MQYMYRKLPIFPEVLSNNFELFKIKALYIRVIPNFEKIWYPPWLGSKYNLKYKMSWLFELFCVFNERHMIKS